ncbi:MAG: hypothetical protein AAF664_10130 [Planctomycetota bacterium]
MMDLSSRFDFFETHLLKSMNLCGTRFAAPPIVLLICVLTLFAGVRSALADQTKAKPSSDFPGWQGIRVIQQDGRPRTMRRADLDGDGRQELIVVNDRYSRLDIYRFVDAANREAEANLNDDFESPNRLSMAANVERRELQLEQLPRDIVVDKIGSDGKIRLAVLVTSPNRILFYEPDDESGWEQVRKVDLLEGSLLPLKQTMLFAGDGDNGRLLVAFRHGIQQVALDQTTRPKWIRPRSKRNLVSWWLADIDGDQNSDIVEQRSDDAHSIYWMPARDTVRFDTPRPIYDRQLGGAEVLSGYDKAQLVFLDASGQGLVRRYEHRKRDEQAMIALRPLPASSGQNDVWCGIQLGMEKSIVMVDPDRPRLSVYRSSDSGWESMGDFPALSDIKALTAPQAEPGTLLIRTDDNADLFKCEWDGGRLTYPKQWSPDETNADRAIVALETTGTTTWWVQRIGSDLHLHLWKSDDPQPKLEVFKGVGGTVQEVVWLGENRILIQDRRSRGLRVASSQSSKKDEWAKAKVEQPSHLQQGGLGEYNLIDVDGEPRVCRMVDGVAQWLDDELQPIEQVMLEGGRELLDFVADSTTSGWALQKDEPYLFRIETDESGVPQATDRIKLSEGSSLKRDPVLGIMLVGRDQIVQLGAGAGGVLELVEALDQRSGRVGGMRQSSVNRMLRTDIDMDGREDLLLCDDKKHRLKAVILRDQSMAEIAEWPVFEDLSYPYGGASIENYVTEPRACLGLDFDGDGRPDLALLCHDRLLIYLGGDYINAEQPSAK